MNQPIVSSPCPITLIGGVNPASGTLSEALSIAPSVVAADGGADHVLAAGLAPEAVIGDMDSISDEARNTFKDVLHPIAEQNSTDFDKALRNIDAPLVLALGFLGDRFDHSLAALNVLLKYHDRPVILIGDYDVVFLCPRKIVLKLPVGMRISLMPIAPARVDTDGLKWDVIDGAMSMGGFTGSSNEVAKSPVTIHVLGGLAILTPLAALGAVVEALTDAAPAR